MADIHHPDLQVVVCLVPAVVADIQHPYTGCYCFVLVPGVVVSLVPRVVVEVHHPDL